MWRSALVLATILVVTSSIDVRLFRRYHGSSAKVDCFDYPEPRDLKYFKQLEGGWQKRPRNLRPKIRSTPKPRHISRRMDIILSNNDDIVKEHAKLVQDINSLRQVLYVAPLSDESKDYEDSIFHEILETSTTPRPTTTKPRTKTGIPILLLGGASQKVKSPPVKLPVKHTINLVGTSAPVAKHPYPFVTPTRSPIRVCMATPVSYNPPKRPSLWERIVNTIIPR